MFTQARQDLWAAVKVLADGSYTGVGFAAAVKATLGVEVEIAKRAELHRFVVMPRRWVVGVSS